LLLSQAAYILMIVICHPAAGAQLETAQVERLRLLLIKGAARVKGFRLAAIGVELSAFYPYADKLRQIVRRLSPSSGLKFE
jgi:hypothetical protein